MTLPITDPILVFTIIAGIILVLPLLAQRLRIPDAVLLLVAGTVFGPHVLGILDRSSAITLFGSVGILYIMFLAGLEVDLHRFSLVRRKSIVFGLLTFAIPMTLGTMAGLYILNMTVMQAVLLASMFASHTLLAYPIASRLGLAKAEPVVVTIGATLITDTLALLVLAVIADMTKGVHMDFWFWAGLITGLGLLAVLARWGIPMAARHFFHNTQENGSAQFLFVLGVMSAYSWLSHFARLEPIVGAFVAGVAFNKLIPERGTLRNRLDFFGNTLFIPFFLISVGMLVDPKSLIGEPESWLTVGTMVVVVVLTKYLAALVAGLVLGYNRSERMVMFGLSVVQAAATLAAVLVGYELKIFDKNVLNGAIAMIIVSGPLGSWLVETFGKKMALRGQGSMVDAPIQEQRLMVSVANPHSAPLLLDLSLNLRDSKSQEPIRVVTIVAPVHGKTDLVVTQGEKLLSDCSMHAAASATSINTSVHVDINPASGILRASQEYRASAVIIGWGSDRSVSARLFGTIFEKIIDDCPARIFLARPMAPLNLTKRIVVPIHPMGHRRHDFAEIGKEITLLAQRLGSQVLMLVADQSKDATRELSKQLKATIPLELMEFPDWSSIRTFLFESIKSDDMIILPTERREGFLWFPSLDKMPEALAEKHPDNNLVVIFPSKDSDDTSHQITSSTALPPIICKSWSPGTDLAHGIGSLLIHLDNPEKQSWKPIHDALLESAALYPVEIAPGIALIHAHDYIVAETTILLGMCPLGLEFNHLTNPVYRVFCLVSPRNQAPEKHLAGLATLARSLKDPEAISKFLSLDNPQEARDFLMYQINRQHEHGRINTP